MTSSADGRDASASRTPCGVRRTPSGGPRSWPRLLTQLLIALSQVLPMYRSSGLGPWKLVRVPDAFPPAWVARQVREAPNWGLLFLMLSQNDAPDEAWFLPEDRPPASPGRGAQVASVRSWNGQTAIVEHDGSCILILRQTYYPGWVYRVDDGPEQPVHKVNGGLQGIPLSGSATSRVEVRYRPTRARALCDGFADGACRISARPWSSRLEGPQGSYARACNAR